MKYSEIKNLEVSELKKRLVQTKQALFDAQMKHKMQRLSNMMELRDYRRDIARLQTTLSSLPESAFISEKKKTSSLKKEEKGKKKSFTKKATEVIKEKKILSDKGQKVSDNKKKEVKKPINEKQKELKTEMKNIPKKQEKKEKKWFGFFSSKKAGKDMKSSGKRSFFRRKSG